MDIFLLSYLFLNVILVILNYIKIMCWIIYLPLVFFFIFDYIFQGKVTMLVYKIKNYINEFYLNFIGWLWKLKYWGKFIYVLDIFLQCILVIKLEFLKVMQELKLSTVPRVTNPVIISHPLYKVPVHPWKNIGVFSIWHFIIYTIIICITVIGFIEDSIYLLLYLFVVCFMIFLFLLCLFIFKGVFKFIFKIVYSIVKIIWIFLSIIIRFILDFILLNFIILLNILLSFFFNLLYIFIYLISFFVILFFNYYHDGLLGCLLKFFFKNISVDRNKKGYAIVIRYFKHRILYNEIIKMPRLSNFTITKFIFSRIKFLYKLNKIILLDCVLLIWNSLTYKNFNFYLERFLDNILVWMLEIRDGVYRLIFVYYKTLIYKIKVVLLNLYVYFKKLKYFWYMVWLGCIKLIKWINFKWFALKVRVKYFLWGPDVFKGIRKDLEIRREIRKEKEK